MRTDFRSELLAAMERSHIANPGDAIAAGLRSLAAPVERKGAVATGATLAQN